MNEKPKSVDIYFYFLRSIVTPHPTFPTCANLLRQKEFADNFALQLDFPLLRPAGLNFKL